MAIAGSNGSGKTTFFDAHLSETGLRFVNADELALELGFHGLDQALLPAEQERARVGVVLGLGQQVGGDRGRAGADTGRSPCRLLAPKYGRHF